MSEPSRKKIKLDTAPQCHPCPSTNSNQVKVSFRDIDNDTVLMITRDFLSTPPEIIQHVISQFLENKIPFNMEQECHLIKTIYGKRNMRIVCLFGIDIIVKSRQPLYRMFRIFEHVNTRVNVKVKYDVKDKIASTFNLKGHWTIHSHAVIHDLLPNIQSCDANGLQYIVDHLWIPRDIGKLVHKNIYPKDIRIFPGTSPSQIQFLKQIDKSKVVQFCIYCFVDSSILDLIASCNENTLVSIDMERETMSMFSLIINDSRFSQLQFRGLYFIGYEDDTQQASTAYLDGDKSIDSECHLFTLIQLVLLRNRNITRLNIANVSIPKECIFSTRNPWNNIFLNIQSLELEDVRMDYTVRTLFLTLPHLQKYYEHLVSYDEDSVLMSVGNLDAIRGSNIQEVRLPIVCVKEDQRGLDNLHELLILKSIKEFTYEANVTLSDDDDEYSEDIKKIINNNINENMKKYKRECIEFDIKEYDDIIYVTLSLK
jgi:hypothetical protein